VVCRCKKAKAQVDVSDIYNDPVAMMEYKVPRWLRLVLCYILPALMCKYMFGESFYLGFYVPG